MRIIHCYYISCNPDVELPEISNIEEKGKADNVKSLPNQVLVFVRFNLKIPYFTFFPESNHVVIKLHDYVCKMASFQNSWKVLKKLDF